LIIFAKAIRKDRLGCFLPRWLLFTTLAAFITLQNNGARPSDALRPSRPAQLVLQGSKVTGVSSKLLARAAVEHKVFVERSQLRSRELSKDAQRKRKR
jgi:hypothetical protein